MYRLRFAAVLGVVTLATATAGLAQSIVLDDGKPGCRLDGVWADNKTNGFSAAGAVGNLYHYTSKYAPAKKTGRETATWTPVFKQAGVYKVEVSFRAGENRSSKVSYQIRHADGTAKKTVNQRDGKDTIWVSLGEFPFKAGEGGAVVLTSDGGGSAVADAARFTPRGGSAGGGDGLDGVMPPAGGDDDAAGAGDAEGGIRLDGRKTGTETYTFTVDGTARITACLATYGPARLQVVAERTDGKRETVMSWERANDRDGTPLMFDGKAVAESIAESSPGDNTAVPTTRRLKGKAGDKLILTLEGQFGRGDPILQLKPGKPGSAATPTASGPADGSAATPADGAPAAP